MMTRSYFCKFVNFLASVIVLFVGPIVHGALPQQIPNPQIQVSPNVKSNSSSLSPVSAELKTNLDTTVKKASKTNSRIKNTQSKSYYLCRFNSEVRTLRLNQNSEGVCYIDYTKLGIDERVGESKSLDICSSVIKNIKSNLENASWKCKNISSTYITVPK